MSVSDELMRPARGEVPRGRPLASPPPETEAAAKLVMAAELLGSRLKEGAAARDAERKLPFDEMAAVKASGILAGRVPRSYGGAEATWLDMSRIMLALSKGDPNVGQAIQSQCVIVETIRADATEEQRRRFFEILLWGGMITNAVAERGGAFYGDAATKLIATRSGYRVDGQKYYSTGSLFAEYLYVTALAEDGSPAAAIVPRDRAGLSIVDDWNGMGQRTTASGTVTLKGVVLDTDEVFFLPRPESRRWHLQAAAQLLHASIDTGIALAALDDALDLCRRKGRPLRESGVERASDDPYILQAVGDMSVRANAAAALVERGARLVDVAADAYFAGVPEDRLFGNASIAVAEARIAASDASLAVSEKLYQVANASGTDRSLNLDRHWRNARTHTTHDPLAYKYKFIGDYLLNGRLPPLTVKI